MGYGYRTGFPGGDIKTFWPDDTDTEMYLDASNSWSLSDIHAHIEEKWPGASMENIQLSSEKIHTDCLGYDLYDAGDYTMFIVIRRVPGA
jgi:hypothetical protein